jgi:hypothetical protein
MGKYEGTFQENFIVPITKTQARSIADQMRLMVWEYNFLGFDLEVAVTATPPNL